MGKRISEKIHWNRFWDRSGDVGQVYDNEERVTRHLTKLVSPRGMRILEVGSGSGRDGIIFAREGGRVVSLDYSMPALELVRSQLDEQGEVSLVCGDAFDLPFEDGTFDLVFHQGLLEHFRNPEEMLEEHRRVLKRGGYILVDVPQRYHYYTLVKHILILAGRWFAGWETEFSVKELEKMLENKGFMVIESYGEWLNPPIWFRMLRKGLMAAGVKVPMYPPPFAFFRRLFRGLRARILKTRWALYTTLVIGTIARKE